MYGGVPFLLDSHRGRAKAARLCTKSDLAKLSRVCRVCRVWAQSGAGAAAPNPTSLAPGARMTVVKHTPSNLIVFGAHFAFLGVTLGFLLGALGAPWAPKGPSLASLWSPFGSELRGAIWGTLGSQGELGMTWGPKWTSNSEQMALK